MLGLLAYSPYHMQYRVMFHYLFLTAALWPWIWLSLWRKWVPGIFNLG